MFTNTYKKIIAGDSNLKQTQRRFKKKAG